MAEPTSSTIISVTSLGIGFSTLFPSVDGNALIGAFAGAMLFAISSKHFSIVERFANMAVSLIFGYLCAPEILLHTTLQESGIAAFFAAASAITLALHSNKLIETIELPPWLRKGKRDE